MTDVADLVLAEARFKYVRSLTTHAEGLIGLTEADGERQWLETAKAVVDMADVAALHETAVAATEDAEGIASVMKEEDEGLVVAGLATRNSCISKRDIITVPSQVVDAALWYWHFSSTSDL